MAVLQRKFRIKHIQCYVIMVISGLVFDIPIDLFRINKSFIFFLEFIDVVYYTMSIHNANNKK